MSIILAGMADVYAACGGRPKTVGGEQVWWFGWNPSTAEQTAQVTRAFRADEDAPQVKGDRVCLWKFPQMVNGGKHIPYNWQLTGSCVNGGANNALSVSHAVWLLRLGRAAAWNIPFTLPAYGYSRFKAFGDNTPGEGSTGDAMAQALRDFGYTQYNQAGITLPKINIYTNAYCYTAAVEMQYSAARNCPADVKAACTGHKLEFVKVTNLTEAETEIRRCRPLTVAGNWGSTMRMQYKGTGERRVLFGEYAASWEHQQSVLGLWMHPDFGRLWYVLNQWFQLVNGVAVPVHGAPGTDEPPGGYWVDDSMLQHQFNYRFGEVRSFVRTDNPFVNGDAMLSVVAV